MFMGYKEGDACTCMPGYTGKDCQIKSKPCVCSVPYKLMDNDVGSYTIIDCNQEFEPGDLNMHIII